MIRFPLSFAKKIDFLFESGGLREPEPFDQNAIDFSSNDYLGMVHDNTLSIGINARLASDFSGNGRVYGATGSRLISGDGKLIHQLEEKIAVFHRAPSALLFNNGYSANVALFGAITEKDDTIIFDKKVHASIRDGIRLAGCKSFGFFHNDLSDLESKLAQATGNIFIVVESLYSMDGDFAPLVEIARIVTKAGGYLIVDEAHTGGVLGENGRGYVDFLGLTEKVFARIFTYGKAFGVFGASVTGPEPLIKVLVNFGRSFIFTTALPGYNLAAIDTAYDAIREAGDQRMQLLKNVEHMEKYSSLVVGAKGGHIKYIPVPGNKAVLEVAAKLRAEQFFVKAIRYPTVPQGEERIRLGVHSHNTPEQIDGLIKVIRGAGGP